MFVCFALYVYFNKCDQFPFSVLCFSLIFLIMMMMMMVCHNDDKNFHFHFCFVHKSVLFLLFSMAQYFVTKKNTHAFGVWIQSEREIHFVVNQIRFHQKNKSSSFEWLLLFESDTKHPHNSFMNKFSQIWFDQTKTNLVICSSYRFFSSENFLHSGRVFLKWIYDYVFFRAAAVTIITQSLILLIVLFFAEKICKFFYFHYPKWLCFHVFMFFGILNEWMNICVKFNRFV